MYNGQTNCYWAFDDNAQKDCPVSGFEPGLQQVDGGTAYQFVSWYLGRLTEYLQW